MPPLVSSFNGLKQIDYMIRFSKVVLYVVVFRRNTEFYKLVLECSRLFKKTMCLSFNFHTLNITKGENPALTFYIVFFFFGFFVISFAIRVRYSLTDSTFSIFMNLYDLKLLQCFLSKS